MKVLLQCVLLIQFLLASNKSIPVFQKCWSRKEINIGIYQNFSYQFVFVKENDKVELQCNDWYFEIIRCLLSRQSKLTIHSTSFDLQNADIYWEKVDITLDKTEKSHPLNKQFKSFEKGLKILANSSLYIKKVKTKHSGLYSCYRNLSSADYNSSLTAHSETYSYFLDVSNRKNKPSNGTYTEWNYYEDYVYKPGEKLMQSIPHINQTLKPSLMVHWSDWGKCICGKYTYDTRSYRYANCCVKFYHGLVLPCQSLALKGIRPEIAKILGNISTFKEYQRCMDDCVPGIVF